MRCLCILGTDTEVGKTYVSAELARGLVADGRRVGVYKPVASGIPLGSGASDADLLHAAAGLACPITRVCPQCFPAPLAPPIAAERIGRKVDEELLISGAVWWREQCELLLVEGAGGVLSPVSQRWTCLDLALQLAAALGGIDILLVSQHRLGGVNQVLMAIEAIERRGLPLLGTFINCTATFGSGQPAAIEPPSLASNLQLLATFAPAHRFFTTKFQLRDAVTSELVGHSR